MCHIIPLNVLKMTSFFKFGNIKIIELGHLMAKPLTNVDGSTTLKMNRCCRNILNK